MMYAEQDTRIRLPGPWIEHPDRDWAFQTRMLLDAILDALDEAQLVLTLSRSERQRQSFP